MSTAQQTFVPLQVTTDPSYGGRWTSLRAGGREWLWSRPEPRRSNVAPGDDFADAGGLEECIPTVRGLPDHGDAWSRPWRRQDDGETVECPDFTLSRRITLHDGAVVATYRLLAEPGYRFLWAAHALLDVSPAAQIRMPVGTPARLFPEAAPHLNRDWPTSAPWIEDTWPAPCGFPLETCGPDDGSAVGAAIGPRHQSISVDVADGVDTLHMELHAPSQPVSVALWRNLGGFPAAAPYRSIGVEPMLGCGFDLSQAPEDEAAVVPPSGVVTWMLRVHASRDEVVA